jgi:hypothetical protein
LATLTVRVTLAPGATGFGVCCVTVTVLTSANTGEAVAIVGMSSIAVTMAMAKRRQILDP